MFSGRRLSAKRIMIAALLVALALGVAHAQEGSPEAQAGEVTFLLPPGDFHKVSDLVPLPEFIPGMGILFVDPATLPIGPFLGYAKDGTLLNITFMVPLADLENRKNYPELAQSIGGFVVDHVDLEYNPGHPGVEEPHYHIVLWRVSPHDKALLAQ